MPQEHQQFLILVAIKIQIDIKITHKFLLDLSGLHIPIRIQNKKRDCRVLLTFSMPVLFSHGLSILYINFIIISLMDSISYSYHFDYSQNLSFFYLGTPLFSVLPLQNVSASPLQYSVELKTQERIVQKNLTQPSSQEKSSRKTWTRQQDQKMLEIIQNLNLKQYKKMPYRIIAKHFPDRTSKQIRERYLNKLDNSICNKLFTPEEDDKIYTFYLENGPKWKKLSILLPGRTSTSLKNRFNTKLKQRLFQNQKQVEGIIPFGSFSSTKVEQGIND